MAIGEHVDHRLVRSAAELLQRPLLYVADIPYLLMHPDELRPRAASMQPSLQPVSVEGFAAWWDAILKYRSQLSTLAESVDALRDGMRRYWSTEAGIRFWAAQREGAGPA